MRRPRRRAARAGGGGRHTLHGHGEAFFSDFTCPSVPILSQGTVRWASSPREKNALRLTAHRDRRRVQPSAFAPIHRPHRQRAEQPRPLRWPKRCAGRSGVRWLPGARPRSRGAAVGTARGQPDALFQAWHRLAGRRCLVRALQAAPRDAVRIHLRRCACRAISARTYHGCTDSLWLY
jgi:hypothetical protein